MFRLAGTLVCIVLLSIISSARPAHAASVLFDLESVPATVSGGLTSLVVTSGGVTMTITREGGATFDIQQVFGFPPVFGSRVLSTFLSSNTPAAFLINLSQPTYFFGLDFGDIANDVDTVTMSAYTGLNQVGLLQSTTFPYPGLGFPSVETVSIGGPFPALSLRVVSDSPVGFSVYLDNIRLETEPLSAVPEPASLVLLATGLAGARFRARRRQ